MITIADGDLFVHKWTRWDYETLILFAQFWVNRGIDASLPFLDALEEGGRIDQRAALDLEPATVFEIYISLDFRYEVFFCNG
jgi:hypothetical protein